MFSIASDDQEYTRPRLFRINTKVFQFFLRTTRFREAKGFTLVLRRLGKVFDATYKDDFSRGPVVVLSALTASNLADR